MAWANQDKCAIVGVGATDYYVRGKSWPRTINDMAAEAIMNACADAGISHKQIDGIAYYSGAGAGYLDKFDTASLMETLGMPHISFSASLTSGGGGCPGAIGLATAGLMNEDCTYTITLMALQQLPQHRLGVVFGAGAPTPENSFLQPSGLVGPGHLMSMLTRRHMHLYGTKPEALKGIVQAQSSAPQSRER
jgi:acetyl-CoA acetyltransferase